MADTTVLREFLVRLGFDIDNAEHRKFVSSVEDSTVKVKAFAAAVGISAGSIVAGFTKIVSGMDQLYFASQRTKASVEGIQAVGFAASQLGSSAEAARASIEGLARFMRNSPGGEALVRSIGVATRDAGGHLRDTSNILQDLGKRFASMPYYRANAYAQALGIDERTLMALREGVGQFSDVYRDMLQKAGLDSDKAAKSSHGFATEVRSLGSAFEILGKKSATSVTEQSTDYVRRFRELIVKNFPQISEVISGVAKGLLFVADVISTLALRAIQGISQIVEWFQNLDEGSKKTIKMIGAIGAAWTLLNTIFSASPIGRVLALGTALLALYDDYKVWKEGGKSLIDWENWEPAIEKAKHALRTLGAFLSGMAKTVSQEWGLLGDAIKAVMERRWGDAWKAIKQIAVVEQKSNEEGLKAAKDEWNAPESGRNGDSSAPAPNSSLPRGIRNNNPGNLNFAGQPGATKEGGANGRFAVFRSAEEGLRALADQLRRYGARGINTVRSIISKYAPPSENNTAGYIQNLSKSLGVNADAALNLNDPKVLQSLMASIVKLENGRNPYGSELYGRAVGAAGAPAGGVSVSQQTTINVTGAGDPERTASAIGREQNGVNQRLIRNLQPRIS